MKRYSRMTEASVNAADTAMILARTIYDFNSTEALRLQTKDKWNQFVIELNRARQEVSLHQHHDGITGFVPIHFRFWKNKPTHTHTHTHTRIYIFIRMEKIIKKKKK